jgi:hypothetical protein
MSKTLTKDQEKKLSEEIILGKDKVVILDLINKTKELLVTESVNRHSETAYFYFLFTFFFILAGFITAWWLSTQYTQAAKYFNNFFCNVKKY